ncbi:MerR family transcriptional regulator [Nocardia coffeae]|uniref:MerR family transcriptional regulator n=1 Tax=Nocardia coffeae TaxID=2873381 RepID=UPI0027DFB239|nr:MerR family transcriptional regulator [Nocardia coffeae]
MQAEYTIDELARVADTTVRSVRVYHERGLLPSPELRGRIGYYGSGHLHRLQTISRLLSRGMKLNGIRELLEAWDRGDGLAEVLGVPGQPVERATIAVTRPQPVTDPTANAGPAPDDRKTLAIRRPAPQPADPATRLVDAGLSSAEALALIERLRADCDRIAERHVGELFHRLAGQSSERSGRLTDDRAGGDSPTETARLAVTRALTELLDHAFTGHRNIA